MRMKRVLSGLGLLIAFPLALLLVLQLARRVLFVLQHRGLDCATCEGSPMAFLLHTGVEMLLCVPASRAAIRLWKMLRS